MPHARSCRQVVASAVLTVFATELRAWHGSEPLWKVFWGYGVVASSILALFYVLAAREERVIVQQILLILFAGYGLDSHRRLALCGQFRHALANARSQPYGCLGGEYRPGVGFPAARVARDIRRALTLCRLRLQTAPSARTRRTRSMLSPDAVLDLIARPLSALPLLPCCPDGTESARRQLRLSWVKGYRSGQATTPSARPPATESFRLIKVLPLSATCGLMQRIMRRERIAELSDAAAPCPSRHIAFSEAGVLCGSMLGANGNSYIARRLLGQSCRAGKRDPIRHGRGT
jgi:hypothetical protein